MESPVKFDLSQLSYPAVLQVVIPWLPGGVITCGAIYLNLADVRSLITTPILPTAAKVVLSLFGTYTMGILLYGITETFFASLAYVAGVAVGKWGVDVSKIEPWKNQVWRKVARAYLGPAAPPTDEVQNPEALKIKLALLKLIDDPGRRAEQQVQIDQDELKLQLSDSEWFWWHSVIQQRFPRETRVDALQQSQLAVVAMLFSIGWAGAVLLSLAPSVHWGLWFLVILSIVAGLVGDAGIAFNDYNARMDPNATGLTARMLTASALLPGEREIRR